MYAKECDGRFEVALFDEETLKNIFGSKNSGGGFDGFGSSNGVTSDTSGFVNPGTTEPITEEERRAYIAKECAQNKARAERYCFGALAKVSKGRCDKYLQYCV